MHDKLKKVYGLVSLFLKTIVSVFNVILSGGLFSCRHNIKNKNQLATLLANGPSLKDVLTKHKHLLEGTDIMVLNFFAKNSAFWELHPRYYIILDPAFFVPNFVVASEETVANPISAADRLVAEILKVDWDMYFFIPASKMANSFVHRVKVNSHINVRRYNATRIEGFDGFQFWAFRHGLGVPSSRNIIIPGLLNLINMGYKKIYMYGAEFSWTKTMDIDPDNGKMFFNDRHIDNKDEMRFFGRGGYRWWLEAIIAMLYGVDQVAKYAETRGVKIINRTKGSFIDSFEYENIDKLS